MASIFVLAAIGQLKLSAVVLLIVLWAALALGLRSRLELGIPACGSLGLGRREWIHLAIFAALVLPCFVLAASPDVAWDAGVYHLTLPKLYIAHHGFRAVAMNVYSHWPLNTELLFAGAMLAKDHILATTLHWGFGILCLYGIHVSAAR